MSLLAIAVFLTVAPGLARGQPAQDEEFAREARENSVGLAREEPIIDVVDQFNLSVQSNATRHGRPRPPELTETEVLAALRFNGHVKDASSRLARACRAAASSRRIPKGARLMLGSYSVETATEGISRTERVFMWNVVLYFFVDEVPMSLSSSMIHVRLQFVGTSD